MWLIYHPSTALCSSKIPISPPVLYQWALHTFAIINPLPIKSLITVIGKYHYHAGFVRSRSGLACAHMGLNGFNAYIRNHINCADLFSSLVASRPDLFNIITPPAFALTALQTVPSSSVSASDNNNNHKSVSRANACTCTKAVYEAVYQQGEVMFTSTVVEGLYARHSRDVPKSKDRSKIHTASISCLDECNRATVWR